MTKPGVRFTGPWGGLNRFHRDLDKIVRRAANPALSLVASEYQAYWRSAILTGSLALPPKAPLTVETETGSGPPLVYKKKLVRGIKKLPPGNRFDTYFVGAIDPEIIKIGLAHEYEKTIRPKTARALAVPATKKARQYPNPRTYPWKHGKGFFKPHKDSKSFGGLYEKTGRKGRINKYGEQSQRFRIVYYLFREITLPKRASLALTSQIFIPIGQRMFAAIVLSAVIERFHRMKQTGKNPSVLSIYGL